jgi:hypothetical protein
MFFIPPEGIRENKEQPAEILTAVVMNTAAF